MRLIAGAVLLTAVSCATKTPVPVVRPWNDLARTDVSIDDDERKLWEEAKEQRAAFAKDGIIVADEKLTTYLNGMLAALTFEPLPAEAPRPAVHVVRDSLRTAATMPDGGILVTTSTLAALQNEAQLAALLGHELGHFMARHGLIQERFAKASRSTVERRDLSRQSEVYCDHFALAAMQRGGYDPREMPRMLQLIESEEDARLSRTDPFPSHPFIEDRVRNLTSQIHGAPDETLRVGADSYDEAVAAILPVAVEVELKSRLLDRAASSIARYLALRPESGRGYYLKAEHARLTEREGRRSATARGAYERAVELTPDDPEAVRALGFLYQGDGDVVRATAMLEKYLSLVPDAADRKLIERYLGGNGSE